MYLCPKCQKEVEYLYWYEYNPMNHEFWWCEDCALFKYWKKRKLKRHPLAIDLSTDEMRKRGYTSNH